jgi:hypothetical protein
MDACDYTTIWEEHTLYYTADTFRHGLSVAALDIVRMENYEYPFENSLVAIATSNGAGNVASPPAAAVERERQRGITFGRSYAAYREKVRRFVGEYRRSRGRIALFGAGHLACMFVNLFELGEWMECVIDDNPHKLGLYMPGSKLPIVTSTELLKSDITLCLLSLNPIGQQKVIERNAAFVARGGTFASIFPASANAIAC